jgi:hypothetical protein
VEGVAEMGTDVRFGSKADIEAHQSDVCFTPESGHGLCPAAERAAGETVGRLRGGNVQACYVVNGKDCTRLLTAYARQ